MVGVGIWSQSRYMHSWSEIPNTLLFFHTTFTQLSHLTAFCTAALRQQMGCEQIVQAVHFSSSDPSSQGGLPVAAGGGLRKEDTATQ